MSKLTKKAEENIMIRKTIKCPVCYQAFEADSDGKVPLHGFMSLLNPVYHTCKGSGQKPKKEKKS